MIPKTDNPWRTVEHQAERYMVRAVDGVVWVSRISDRALWLYDPASTAPAWCLEQTVSQLPMF